jgi:hypothetical protein
MYLHILLNTLGIVGGLYSFYNHVKLKDKIEELELSLKNYEKNLNGIKIEIDELYKQLNHFSDSNIVIIE